MTMIKNKIKIILELGFDKLRIDGADLEFEIIKFNKINIYLNNIIH